MRKVAQRVAQAALAAWVLALGVGCSEPEFVPAERRLTPAPVVETSAVVPLPREAPALDPLRVALGRELFSDPILSPDDAVSCATCHDLTRGGADGLRRSRAPSRPEGPINVPGIFNLAWASRFSWSGRFSTLDEMMDVAMTAPAAMASTWEGSVERLSQSSRYRARFGEAYGGAPSERFLRDALASYLYSLTTPDAPFDRWLRGDESAISEEAVEGYRQFRDLGCSSCHQGVLIGGNMFQRFGVLRDYFEDRREVTRADLGLYVGTQRDEDRHVFRVPSLRNVALTAPYFHDGSAASLEEAVTTMARFRLGRILRPTQIASLVAFLRTLSGVAPR